MHAFSWRQSGQNVFDVVPKLIDRGIQILRIRHESVFIYSLSKMLSEENISFK
jgi:hypothetical protein